MATYVPGSEQYLPDIKPFTPDYKFLSAVLDTRQDKYNTNWQATNDVYNKVVYAGLSRADTNEQREQYVNNLAPSLEKIAGMDLSLAQNAESAKAVFAPFFEDKLIVKDMVYTAGYRKEMDYANRLLASNDRSQRERHWGPGVKALQYKMEDFVNGTADQALNASLPKYVEDADLFETAQQILSEMKPPLKMKVTRAKRNPDGSIDPMWNIEQQNGDLVVGPALQYIQNTLQDDPRVQRAYQTQSYVQSRDFAAEGIAAGNFASIQEGQQAWAAETISRVEALNASRVPKAQAQVKELKNINLRWGDYQKTNGIIPGSDDDKLMKEQLSAYEAVKAKLSNEMQVQDLLKQPIPEGSDATLNRAYQLLMGANMMGDMEKAAQNYSMREFEAINVETPYSKFKYDMTKQNARARDARKLMLDREAIRDKNQRQLAKEKGELMFDGKGNPLAGYFDGENTRAGDSSTLGYKLDKDGNIDPNFNVVLNGTTLPYNNLKDKITAEEVGLITQSLLLLNPEGEDGNQNYSIDIPTDDPNVTNQETGDIDYIKRVLLDKDDKGNFKNIKAVNKLYKDYSGQILNTEQIKADYPSLVSSKGYRDLFGSVTGLDQKTNNLEQSLLGAYRIQKETYDATKLLSLGDENVKGFMDNGMPDIWEEDDQGNPVPLTEEQYVKKVLSLVEEGVITNYNSSNWDTNTNKNYLKPAAAKEEFLNFIDTEVVRPNGTIGRETKQVISESPLPEARLSRPYSSIMFTDKTGKQVRATDRDQLDPATTRRVQEVDVRSVTNEAKEAYKGLYEKMNQGLTNSLGDGETYKTATLQSVLSGAGNTVGDLASNPTYIASIDPKAPNAAGNRMAADLFSQIDALERQGIKPMFIQGSLNDVEGEIKGDGSGLYQRVLEMYKADLRSYVNNPKSPNSPSSSPRATIEYMPVYGATDDGEKTTAGYRIKFNADWLASKIEGGSDPSKQYGALKSSDFESLSNGISVVYEQKDDISPRSNMRVLDYSSPVLSGIAANPNGYYQPPAPIDENGDKAGTYRFVKISDQEYMLNWSFMNYQEGGNFVKGPTLSSRIFVNSTGPARTLDKEELKIKNIFAKKGAANKRSKDKDVAVNGKK